MTLVQDHGCEMPCEQGEYDDDDDDDVDDDYRGVWPHLPQHRGHQVLAQPGHAGRRHLRQVQPPLPQGPPGGPGVP